MNNLSLLENLVVDSYSNWDYEKTVKLCLILLDQDSSNVIWLEYLELSKIKLLSNWNDSILWDMIDSIDFLNSFDILELLWKVTETLWDGLSWSFNSITSIASTTWDIVISACDITWQCIVIVWETTLEITKATAEVLLSLWDISW